MRLLALWLLLFAVYLVGNELPTPEEQDYLRIAATLVRDGEVVRSPLGLGFPLLIAPLEGLGHEAVEVALAAVAALGFVLAALLGRRIVPEPYASAGAGLAGLSAPAVAYSGAILPAMTAGTLLAGATLCAVSARESPRPAPVFGAAAMLALLPWLDPLLTIPALPIGVALYLWCREGRRATMGLIAVELAVASLVLYATLNERLYGGFTPWSDIPGGLSGTGAETLGQHLERLPRLVTLWLDPGAGLLRWAPIFAFVPFAAWLLWRSRREGLARLVPERVDRRGGGLPGAGRVRHRAARRDVPRPDDRHRAVRRPVPDPGPTRRGRADRLGAAPRAARRRGARRDHARDQRLAADVTVGHWTG